MNDEYARDPRYVYFIQSVTGGPIKIGVGGDPLRRLVALQPGNPERLQIIGVILGGGRARERDLHFRFRAVRMSGEWFEPSAELLALIAKETAPYDLPSLQRYGRGERAASRPDVERAGFGVKVNHRKLRDLRKRCGMTISALAAQVDVSHQYVSFIERGARDPLLPVLERISAALNVEARELLGPQTSHPQPARVGGGAAVAGVGLAAAPVAASP